MGRGTRTVTNGTEVFWPLGHLSNQTKATVPSPFVWSKQTATNGNLIDIELVNERYQ